MGKRAKVTSDFMIVARIESLILGKGNDDAIKRAVAYIDAGADAILIHSRQPRIDEIAEFCKNYSNLSKRLPLVVVPTSYNDIYEKNLQELNINVVIYANQLLRSAYPSMVKTAKSILKHGRSKEIDYSLLPIKEILTLVPECKW